MEDGQAAHSGVEHADGSRIHQAILRRRAVGRRRSGRARARRRLRGSYKTRVRARLAALGLLATLAAPAAHAADAQPRLVVNGRVGKVPSEIVLRHVADALLRARPRPVGVHAELGQAAGATLGAAAADQIVRQRARERSTGPVAVAPEGTLACDGPSHAAVWTIAARRRDADGRRRVARRGRPGAGAAPRLPRRHRGRPADAAARRDDPDAAGDSRAPGLGGAPLGAPTARSVASVATLAIPAKVTLKGALQRFKHQIARVGDGARGGRPGARRTARRRLDRRASRPR